MGLYRSSDDRLIAGVCGGFADKLGFNSSGFRIVTFIVSFFFAAWTLPIVAYIACWLLLPTRPTRNSGATEPAEPADE